MQYFHLLKYGSIPLEIEDNVNITLNINGTA